mmetsp:Transcript_75579/g.216405  ORF Transcript_75579/g.216405 Transcript_75579/m.216405 type:complete len:206 (-) Transcript_75579:1191-1808(-)
MAREVAAVALQQIVSVSEPIFLQRLHDLHHLSLCEVRGAHGDGLAIPVLGVGAGPNVVDSRPVLESIAKAPLVAVHFHACMEGTGAYRPDNVVHPFDGVAGDVVDMQPDISWLQIAHLAGGLFAAAPGSLLANLLSGNHQWRHRTIRWIVMVLRLEGRRGRARRSRHGVRAGHRRAQEALEATLAVDLSDGSKRAGNPSQTASVA